MSVTHSALAPLAAKAASAELDPQVRLVAARDCLWLLQREGVPEPSATIARAVLSRTVEDIKSDRRAATIGYDDFSYWREFGIGESNRLADVAALRPEVAITCAQLLFEAGRHAEALPFFDRVLSHQPQAAAVLLACYNLEVLSRQRSSLELAERALALLDVEYRDLFRDPPFEAELLHLTGHLLLLRGRFSATETLGFERLGVQRLAGASQRDPSYSACYASSFAEYGDFLGSIEACLEIIQRQNFHSLPTRDAQLVQLEVLFYLAYSLMTVGELERSRMCFETFAAVTSRLGLLEARDHAQLFLVKLMLKRRSILEHSDIDLRKAYRKLRTLAFDAALSRPMGEECLRYEEMLKLLVSITKERQEVSEHHLATLGAAALEMVTHLSAQRQEILSGVRIVIASAHPDGDSLEPAFDEIKRRIGHLASLSIEHLEESHSPLGESSRPYASFVLCRVSSLSAETRATMSPNVIPFASNAAEVVGVPDLRGALDLLAVGLAVVASKRFLTQDEYVFGLVPCLESPATKFQHPQYSFMSVL